MVNILKECAATEAILESNNKFIMQCVNCSIATQMRAEWQSRLAHSDCSSMFLPLSNNGVNVKIDHGKYWKRKHASCLGHIAHNRRYRNESESMMGIVNISKHSFVVGEV